MSGVTYTCDLCGFQSEDRAAVLAHVKRAHGVADPVEVGAVDQADGLLTLRQGDQETVIDLAAWLTEALAGREPGAAIDLTQTRAALDRAAAAIIPTEPDKWAGWLVYLLECLDANGDTAGAGYDFRGVLLGVQDAIATRLELGRW